MGQQVVPPGQKGEPLGHWQAPLTQIVPPVQALPQAPQFALLVVRSVGVHWPLMQQAPGSQQATLSELREAQTFCTLSPHCLQALLQFFRWAGCRRLLQKAEQGLGAPQALPRPSAASSAPARPPPSRRSASRRDTPRARSLAHSSNSN